MGARVDLAALLLLLGVLALGWYMLRRRPAFEEPHIAFPTLENFPKGSTRTRLAGLPPLLFLAAIGLFSLAFVDPHTVMPRAPEYEGGTAVPRSGVAIYFALDQSGSMREDVSVPYSIDASGKMSKIALLKKVTSQFIDGNKAKDEPGLQGDLVGLVSFSRGARVLAPLTLDHQVVLKDIAGIQLSHTQDTDGTAIGYAIYKTASMITATRHYAQEMLAAGQKPPYQIKGSVIIVVTDGLQEPSPLDKGKRFRNMDIPEAAAYAKEQGIRLYIVNVDPSITSDEFIPHRHVMEKATRMTGGNFIIAGQGKPLSSVYDEIAHLEKGTISQTEEVKEDMRRSFSLYPWLVGLGLMCLLAGILLESIGLRRVP